MGSRRIGSHELPLRKALEPDDPSTRVPGTEQWSIKSFIRKILYTMKSVDLLLTHGLITPNMGASESDFPFLDRI
jgi:hypothetical protein